MSVAARWTIATAVAACIATAPTRAGAQATAAAAPGVAGAGAATPRDPAKTALVRQLIERTQAADQTIAIMEATLPAQRQMTPHIPAVFWDRFIVETKARRGELVEMFSAVYERHFTVEELRLLLAFYDTPTGRKLLSALPAITRESMAAGEVWGQRIGEAVAAQLTAEGVFATP